MPRLGWWLVGRSPAPSCFSLSLTPPPATSSLSSPSPQLLNHRVPLYKVSSSGQSGALCKIKPAQLPPPAQCQHHTASAQPIL